MEKVIALILVLALSVAVGFIYADEINSFNESVVDSVIGLVVNINPPKDADVLYERIDTQMKELSIYRTNATVYMKQYSDDTEIITEVIDKTIRSKLSVEDYYFLNVQENKVVVESEGYESYSKSVYAYENGKAYIAVGIDGVEQRLSAPMSKEDFIDFMDMDSEKFDVASAKNKSYSYLKDERGWILRYSEYEYEDIRVFGEAFFGSDVFDEHKLLDINVEIVADKSFYVTDMRVKFIFEGTEEEIGPGVDYMSDDEDEKRVEPLYATAEVKVKQPEMSIDYKYLYDAESVERVELEYDKYTEVDDVMPLKHYSEFMNDIIAAESQSARINVDTIYRINKTAYRYIDDGLVNYGEGENGFFFNVSFDGDSGSYNLDYAVGTLTLTQKGNKQYEECDEKSARAILESYIAIDHYRSYKVTDIVVSGQDMYWLVLDIDPNDVLSAENASGVSSITATIAVYHTSDAILVQTSEMRLELVNGNTIEEVITIDYDYKGK